MEKSFIRLADKYHHYVSFTVLLAIVGTYFASGKKLLRNCVEVPYPLPSGLYGAGIDDLQHVGFWLVAFICIRYVLNTYIFLPWAKVSRVPEHKVTRFAEQAYMGVYYTISFSWGLVAAMEEPFWLDTKHLWIGYPHTEHKLFYKLYFLVQLAFWLQCIFITVIEKWRADFVEMMLHHFITCSLISGSYYFNFSRVAMAILVEQDLADIILPVAKMLKYAQYRTTTDVCFAIFAVVWILTRHGIFFWIYWSIWTEAPKYVEIKWDPESGHYFTHVVHRNFLAGLTALQLLMLYWLKLLIAAIVRALRAGAVEDQRSDSEDEAEATDKKKKKTKKVD